MNEQPWCNGNEAEVLINGDEYFPRVFSAIKNAKHEVLLETFILREDEVGIALGRTLSAAAKRGVHVEITIDDYGSSDLSKEFIASMTEAGVHLHVFDPQPKFFGTRLNLFRRLHRKIVVVDAEIAFVGGINYSADHLISFGPEAKQDYAVQVRGPIVNEVHKACWQLFNYGPKQNQKNFSANAVTAVNNAVFNYAGDARMQLAIRDNLYHKKDIEQHYMRAIQGAKHRLMIANAYFFPGYRLLRAIRLAAERGVAVTLILQGRPDMPWVSACTRLLYEYLLRSGVVIYEYCQRPLHGKVALADDKWATVGSSNLDPLSLALNLEANLIIESKAFNNHLYEHLQSLAKSNCKPVNRKLAKHGYWWRLLFISASFHFLRFFPTVVGWLPVHSPKLQLLTASSKALGRTQSTKHIEDVASMQREHKAQKIL